MASLILLILILPLSGGVADGLVDASPDEIIRSERISPYDIAETALYLATLGPHAVVHQVIVDRLGADW
jgi:3-oxoacyl-[acyl-carrier protein] reductase